MGAPITLEERVMRLEEEVFFLEEEIRILRDAIAYYISNGADQGRSHEVRIIYTGDIH